MTFSTSNLRQTWTTSSRTHCSGSRPENSSSVLVSACALPAGGEIRNVVTLFRGMGGAPACSSSVHGKKAGVGQRVESHPDLKNMGAFMRALILALGLAIPLAQPASANDCSGAVDNYNSTTSDLSGYLRRYANCLSSSSGRDDCALEFRRVKNSQSDFESAVSQLQYNDCLN